MRRNSGISLCLALILVACSNDSSSDAEPPGTDSTQKAVPDTADVGKAVSVAERGGTITVGEETWVIVPRSCSVYPGPIANISGHAANDPSLEIVIDYGGPDQVVVGSGRDALWHARKETLEVQIEGRIVRGTATFTEEFGGSGKSADGSFEVNCG